MVMCHLRQYSATKCILIVFCPGELPQWNARGKIKKIVVEELSKMQ